MKQKIEQLIKSTSQARRAVLFFFVLGLISLWISYYPVEKNQDNDVPKLENESVDTYIPKGFVLVPLDLSNLESLNSFIGQAGVVDLYKSRDGQKGTRIATRVKIIRAPLNPQLFAALVPEERSSDLLNYNESLFAVVQNKSESSGSIHSQKTMSKKSIIYQN